MKQDFLEQYKLRRKRMGIEVKEVKEVLTNALNKLNKYNDNDIINTSNNLRDLQDWMEVLVLWNLNGEDDMYIDLRDINIKEE
jgi:hypothetical protein